MDGSRLMKVLSVCQWIQQTSSSEELLSFLTFFASKYNTSTCQQLFSDLFWNFEHNLDDNLIDTLWKQFSIAKTHRQQRQAQQSSTEGTTVINKTTDTNTNTHSATNNSHFITDNINDSSRISTLSENAFNCIGSYLTLHDSLILCHCNKMIHKMVQNEEYFAQCKDNHHLTLSPRRVNTIVKYNCDLFCYLNNCRVLSFVPNININDNDNNNNNNDQNDSNQGFKNKISSTFGSITSGIGYGEQYNAEKTRNLVECGNSTNSIATTATNLNDGCGFCKLVEKSKYDKHFYWFPKLLIQIERIEISNQWHCTFSRLPLEWLLNPLAINSKSNNSNYNLNKLVHVQTPVIKDIIATFVRTTKNTSNNNNTKTKTIEKQRKNTNTTRIEENKENKEKNNNIQPHKQQRKKQKHERFCTMLSKKATVIFCKRYEEFYDNCNETEKRYIRKIETFWYDSKICNINEHLRKLHGNYSKILTTFDNYSISNNNNNNSNGSQHIGSLNCGSIKDLLNVFHRNVKTFEWRFNSQNNDYNNYYKNTKNSSSVNLQKLYFTPFVNFTNRNFAAFRGKNVSSHATRAAKQAALGGDIYNGDESRDHCAFLRVFFNDKCEIYNELVESNRNRNKRGSINITAESEEVESEYEILSLETLTMLNNENISLPSINKLKISLFGSYIFGNNSKNYFSDLCDLLNHYQLMSLLNMRQTVEYLVLSMRYFDLANMINITFITDIISQIIIPQFNKLFEIEMQFALHLNKDNIIANTNNNNNNNNINFNYNYNYNSNSNMSNQHSSLKNKNVKYSKMIDKMKQYYKTCLTRILFSCVDNQNLSKFVIKVNWYGNRIVNKLTGHGHSGKHNNVESSLCNDNFLEVEYIINMSEWENNPNNNRSLLSMSGLWDDWKNQMEYIKNHRESHVRHVFVLIWDEKECTDM